MSTPLTESRGTLLPMLRLAWPVLVEQFLHMLVGFSDLFLTGRYLESQHLAAVNLSIYVLWFFDSLFVVVGIGATALVARLVGGRDLDGARQATNQAFVVGAGIAVVAALLGLWRGEDLVWVMQLRGAAGEAANRYFDYVYPVMPFLMLTAVGIACLRGAGDMLAGMAVMVAVNAVNLAVSWMLVLGVGPFPALGWDGIALGTALGYVTGGLMVVGLLLRGRGGLRLERRLLVPQADWIRRLLRIGLPGGADVLSILACQFVFVAMVNALGETAAAAHGVAIRIESLGYLPGVAFQAAAATLAGQFLGAGDFHRASRSVLMACLVGGGVMTAAGVTFYVFADPLSAFMLRGNQPSIAATAAELLRIVAFAMPPLALLMVFSGALRGAGDTRWPLAFTLLGYLGVRIPVTYLLAYVYELGVHGAWYAMVADLIVRCGLSAFRFRHGGWQRVRV